MLLRIWYLELSYPIPPKETFETTFLCYDSLFYRLNCFLISKIAADCTFHLEVFVCIPTYNHHFCNVFLLSRPGNFRPWRERPISLSVFAITSYSVDTNVQIRGWQLASFHNILQFRMVAFGRVWPWWLNSGFTFGFKFKNFWHIIIHSMAVNSQGGN